MRRNYQSEGEMTKGHDKGHKGHMSDREAMKLALEALEINLPFKYITNGRGEVSPCYNIHPLREEKTKDAMEALRQALEQPKQCECKRRAAAVIE